MGEAYLDYKKGGSGLDINGIIQDYYAYAGEKVNAGDFVEFVNGIASSVDYGTSSTTRLSSENNTGLAISACKLSVNKVFVAHDNANGKLCGIVCTISGATINVGTDTVLSNMIDYCSVVALSETSVFIAYDSGSNYLLCAIACTINGTTIAVGGSATLSSTAYTGLFVKTEFLGNGKVFVLHGYGSSYHLNAIICSVDGTTISKGRNDYTLSSNGNNGGSGNSIGLLPNGNIFVAFNASNSAQLSAMVCTVSDFTIAHGNVQDLSFTENTARTTSTQVLSNGDVFVAHSYNTNFQLYGIVCSVNGTTITAGTDTTLVTSKSATSISTALLDNGKVLIVHGLTSSGTQYLYGMLCTINNSNIATGVDTCLNSETYSGGNIANLLLLDDKVFVAHSYLESIQLNAQIFGIDEIKNIPTNKITKPTYETQVRPATSLPCAGVAKGDGEGGDETGHKDKVSVYVNNV